MCHHSYGKSGGLTSPIPNQHILSDRRVSSLRSPSSFLNKPFDPSPERSGRSRYRLRQHSNNTMAPNDTENQDIRTFFGRNSSSMKTGSRQKQTSHAITGAIEDNLIAFPRTISEYGTPEASSASITLAPGLQSSQSSMNQKVTLPLNHTESQLPSSDDIVSLDIVNYFRSSPITSSSSPPPRGSSLSLPPPFKE